MEVVSKCEPLWAIYHNTTVPPQAYMYMYMHMYMHVSKTTLGMFL